MNFFERYLNQMNKLNHCSYDYNIKPKQLEKGKKNTPLPPLKRGMRKICYLLTLYIFLNFVCSLSYDMSSPFK